MIAEYSVSQTTLDQIFNHFAKIGENELVFLPLTIDILFIGNSERKDELIDYSEVLLVKYKEIIFNHLILNIYTYLFIYIYLFKLWI